MSGSPSKSGEPESAEGKEHNDLETLNAQIKVAALLGREAAVPERLLEKACGNVHKQLQQNLRRVFAGKAVLLGQAAKQNSNCWQEEVAHLLLQGRLQGDAQDLALALTPSQTAVTPSSSLAEDFPGVLTTLAGSRDARVHSLAQLQQQAARQRAQRQLQALEEQLHLLPEEHRLPVLVQLKAAKLRALQQDVRYQVTVERRALHDCHPEELLEWSHLYTAPPAELLSPGLAWRAQELQQAAAKQPNAQEAAEEAAKWERDVAEAKARYEAKQRQRAEHEQQLQARLKEVQSLRQLESNIADSYANLLEEKALKERERELIERTIKERQQFLSDVLSWQRDGFKGSGLQALKRRQARNQGVKNWHTREVRRVQREEAARLAALRSHNYDEYLRLAQRTKDKRLRTLLNKTDDIIRELGLKVHEQKQHNHEAQQKDEQEQQGEGRGTELGDEDTVQRWLDGGTDDPDASARSRQRTYYDMVHSIQEVVKQPSMLVGGGLRGYQLGGLRFFVSLYNNKINGILADEMGLGKTIQTISHIAYLMEAKTNNGPHIVLAPKAVLHNWQREFQKWVPTINVVLYDGTPDERRVLQRQYLDRARFNVLLTNYELVMRDKAALRKIKWELLVVDEGHRLKNSESKLADILRSYSFKHRVLLTGTPIQNSLTELWALLNFVLPKVFNSSETFDEWFAAPFKGQASSSEDASQQLTEEEQLLVINRLHQVIRPFMLRRTKKEVEKELPNKVEHVIKCDMSAWQRVVYNQIAQKGQISLAGGGIRGMQNAAMHLRKACNHPYLFLPQYEPEDPEELVRASGKLELLDRILPKLKASGHRVLLFSQMTKALDIIHDYLNMRQYKFLRLDGSTKNDERGGMLEAFNAENSEYFLFMLSTRAGGLGLNLQTADTVIMFDSDWNPQADLQAEDRAHRIGQKREVLVLVLVTAGTIEEAILDKAQQKRDIDAKVIQAGMFNDNSTHEQRQAVLRAIMAKGALEIADSVHDEKEVNCLLARSPAELELFEEMDEKIKASRPEGYSRLMTLQEVPDWVVQEEEEQGKVRQSSSSLSEEEGEGHRRKRRRTAAKQTSYNETAADARLQKMLETSESDSQGLDKSKSAARPPRAPSHVGQKRKRSGGSEAPSDKGRMSRGRSAGRGGRGRGRGRAARQGSSVDKGPSSGSNSGSDDFSSKGPSASSSDEQEELSKPANTSASDGETDERSNNASRGRGGCNRGPRAGHRGMGRRARSATTALSQQDGQEDGSSSGDDRQQQPGVTAGSDAAGDEGASSGTDDSSVPIGKRAAQRKRAKAGRHGAAAAKKLLTSRLRTESPFIRSTGKGASAEQRASRSTRASTSGSSRDEDAAADRGDTSSKGSGKRVAREPASRAASRLQRSVSAAQLSDEQVASEPQKLAPDANGIEVACAAGIASDREQGTAPAAGIATAAAAAAVAAAGSATVVVVGGANSHAVNVAVGGTPGTALDVLDKRSSGEAGK